MVNDKFLFLVLKTGDELAGYIELKDSPELGEKTVAVLTLSILEKYHRKKFGTSLLEEGIREAKKIFGAKTIILWTNKKNIPDKNHINAVAFPL